MWSIDDLGLIGRHIQHLDVPYDTLHGMIVVEQGTMRSTCETYGIVTCRRAVMGPYLRSVASCCTSLTSNEPANPRALIEIPSKHSRERGKSNIHLRVISRLYGAVDA